MNGVAHVKASKNLTDLRALPNINEKPTDKGAGSYVSTVRKGSANRLGKKYDPHKHIRIFGQKENGGIFLTQGYKKLTNLTVLPDVDEDSLTDRFQTDDDYQTDYEDYSGRYESTDDEIVGIPVLGVEKHVRFDAMVYVR